MVYKFECNLDKQDCATLYPSTQAYKLPFTSQSCIRDNRLEGNVGRCGFPGAPCIVDARGQDNCAGGTYMSSRPVCENGACRGEPGALCWYHMDCNWGINCNGSTSYNGGVCGGYGAFMNNMEVYDGLDFERDYCLSGKAYQNDVGYWQCTGGPPMALTSPPLPSPTASESKHKVSKALIAGVSAAGGVVLVAIIAFIIWRTRRDNRSRERPVAASVFNECSSSIDERKVRDSYVPQSQSTPSSRPYTAGESTTLGPPTDSSSFSNPMMVPSAPIFPPEIQSEDYPGNLPMKQTTTLASSERHSIIQPTPSPRPYAVGESTALGPPTDSPSFSNPMMVPSSPIFPPEIQSEDYPGNLPMKQTTTLASSERHSIIQPTPSPRPYAESTALGPPTDSPSFSNPMMVPSTPIFPPEIQSEDYPGHGNLPMKQTTTLASSERRTTMARQGPDAASNTNSGFYSSAVSASMNAKPFSNKLRHHKGSSEPRTSPTMNT